ncbi:MAG: hypothetical protein AAFV37_03090 [Pseudomonadota bacterium]
MKLVRRGFVSACSLIMASSAAASPVHTVRFAQDPVLLVWHEGALIGHGPSLTLLASETPPPQLMGTGELDPVPIGFNLKSNVQRYEIASNTGFVIETADPSIARPTIRVIDIAPNAQYAEGLLSERDQVVFRQNLKTALYPGSPVSQALTIEIEWTGDRPPALRLRAL